MSEKDVKNLIIESATKYFSKYGFHKTTMEEVAKHIHKAKGVLYYYFKSKEELFEAVLKQELNSVKTELTKIVSKDTDSIMILKEYTLTRFYFLNKAVNYHETLKADFFEKYHFVKDVRDDFAEFERNQIGFILNKGKTEGYFDIKDIESSVNIYMIIITSLEIPLFLQDKYDEYESTMDELASVMFNSLRTQKNLK